MFLFGSRLDEEVKEGDVDILIETDSPLTLIDRVRIKNEYGKRPWPAGGCYLAIREKYPHSTSNHCAKQCGQAGVLAMSDTLLQAEKAHLSGLSEAIQCCIYFLGTSDNDNKIACPLSAVRCPLSAEYLSAHNKRYRIVRIAGRH